MIGLPEQLVMPCPFAGGAGAALATIPGAVTENEVNFTEGFPSVYSSPKSNNGKFVKRSELNAIGNMGTKNDFYRMCGGINTFNPEFCTAVGGYPKGAILDYFNGVQFLKVLSLTENNMHDFRSGDFGSYWQLLNQGQQAVSSMTIADIKDIEIPFSNMGISMIYAFSAPRAGVVSVSVSNYSDVETVTAKGPSYCVGKGILARVFQSNSAIVYPIVTTNQISYEGYTLLPGLPSPASTAIYKGSQAGTVVNPNKGLISVSSGDYVFIGIQNGCDVYVSNTSDLNGSTIKFDLKINLL